MTGTPGIRYSSLILQGKAQACEAYTPLTEGTMDNGFTPHLSWRRYRKEALNLNGSASCLTVYTSHIWMKWSLVLWTKAEAPTEPRCSVNASVISGSDAGVKGGGERGAREAGSNGYSQAQGSTESPTLDSASNRWDSVSECQLDTRGTGFRERVCRH